MPRNPQKTRDRLLQSAFKEIHACGFQGMRVDSVIQKAGLQKGAFYHHFSSKTELAYAVLEEKIKPLVKTVWISPLEKIQNPITDLPTILENFNSHAPAAMMKYGCPLSNLAQEMATQDTGFRERVIIIFDEWIYAVEQLFDTAKAQGYVSDDINTREVACFIVASLEGCISLAKVDNTKNYWQTCASQFRQYLSSLK